MSVLCGNENNFDYYMPGKNRLVQHEVGVFQAPEKARMARPVISNVHPQYFFTLCQRYLE